MNADSLGLSRDELAPLEEISQASGWPLDAVLRASVDVLTNVVPRESEEFAEFVQEFPIYARHLENGRLVDGWQAELRLWRRERDQGPSFGESL